MTIGIGISTYQYTTVKRGKIIFVYQFVDNDDVRIFLETS